jgi:hypothetical protein
MKITFGTGGVNFSLGIFEVTGFPPVPNPTVEYLSLIKINLLTVVAAMLTS